MTTQATSRCKIDGVAVGELSIDMLNPGGMVMSCRYAFVSIAAGLRMGSGNKNTNWSPETYAKLLELTNSIERDVLTDVFEQGSDPTSGAPLLDEGTTDGVPSL